MCFSVANMSTIDQLVHRALLRASLPEPAHRRALREKAGLSQAEVAEALGVSRPAVVRWERGERMPRRQHLDAYVELLRRLAGETSS